MVRFVAVPETEEDLYSVLHGGSSALLVQQSRSNPIGPLEDPKSHLRYLILHPRLLTKRLKPGAITAQRTIHRLRLTPSTKSSGEPPRRVHSPRLAGSGAPK